MRRIALLTAAALPLAAHEGKPVEPHDLALAWEWDLLIVAPLVLAALLYLAGTRRARTGISGAERACFWCGWLCLVVALVSPLHPLGEVLFSAHMAQHELMMVVAAPLLVLGRPLVAFLWALPFGMRRGAGRSAEAAPVRGVWAFVSAPLHAFLIHSAAIWVWHIPAAYDASVANDFVHSLQHGSFLGTALLFWWACIRQHVARRHYGPGLFYIFLTATHTAILGAILTMANAPWYGVYAGTTAAWGLSALEDQQLGGLIMWVPPGFAYLAIFLWLFARWMNAPQFGVRDLNTRILSAVALLLLAGTGCGQRFEDPHFSPQELVPWGDPARGKQLIQAYGCGSCHEIPGVPGAHGNVGPPLEKVSTRTYLAGRVVNSPDSMARWINNPKAVDEKTAMPVTGVSLADARHIVRYLYSLQ